MRLRHATSQLLVIDAQERLVPHVVGGAECVGTIVRLARYAARLAVPLTIAEHYPQGLGLTVPALMSTMALASSDAIRCPKITYSCFAEPALRERIVSLARASRRQIVVAGFEAHVCVAQSALDLIVDDLDVYVVADATSSRREEDRALALERLRQAGAAIVSSEMVAFEWLERADTAAFKDLIQMIRDRS